MIRAVTFLALALPLAAASTAHGQGHGSSGMPDARQMSGIPREDEKATLATISVRVLRGEFSAPAPAGTEVHLIAIKEDGSFEKTTKKVGGDGRVEFADLAIDGSATYYTACLLGEDRLVSRPITLGRMGGSRLALVGRKVDAQGAPVGEPVDDLKEASVPNPPPSEAWVSVRGAGPDTKASVELFLVGESKPVATAAPEVKDGEEGLAKFSALGTGPDKVYVARVVDKGQAFVSQPFQLHASSGARVTVLAYGQLFLGLHAGGQVTDDKVWFEASVVVGNLTGVPRNPGPDGLLVPLPRGFQNATVGEEMAQRVSVVEGKGLVFRGRIPPGEQQVVVQWAQKVQDGQVSFDLPAPLGLLDGQIMIERVPGAVVTPPMGIAAKSRRMDNGREYVVLSNLSVPAGGTLKFHMTGLPQPPVRERVLKTIAGACMLGLLAWAILALVRKPPRDPSRERGKEAALGRHELIARQAELYDELVALETERLTNQADPQLTKRREALVAKVARTHRELDQVDQAS
ncbi:MAG: hypothetical protein HY698_17290 [Deltaproteobacteria bacterium]|nr:hypothetical protein [Deltaproteobacteria bacterium]